MHTRRDLVHFKGEADPFTGDAPNQRVRDVAKDVVELLYTSSGPTGTSSALQVQISTCRHAAHMAYHVHACAWHGLHVMSCIYRAHPRVPAEV